MSALDAARHLTGRDQAEIFFERDAWGLKVLSAREAKGDLVEARCCMVEG